MEYTENNAIVEEEVTPEENTSAAAQQTEDTYEADELIDLYDWDEVEDSEESDGLSTSTKVALGVGGLAAAALAAGGIFGLKKLKNRKQKPADTTDEAPGPKAIPDDKPQAKAIRGRKITLRERLTGHLYLDPEEVKMMQELQALQTQEEDEES